jgi:hypothetical protein
MGLLCGQILFGRAPLESARGNPRGLLVPDSARESSRARKTADAGDGRLLDASLSAWVRRAEVPDAGLAGPVHTELRKECPD